MRAAAITIIAADAVSGRILNLVTSNSVLWQERKRERQRATFPTPEALSYYTYHTSGNFVACGCVSHGHTLTRTNGSYSVYFLEFFRKLIIQEISPRVSGQAGKKRRLTQVGSLDP